LQEEKEMPRVETSNFDSVTEAAKLGVSALVREPEEGHERVLLRNNKPVTVVVSFERFDRPQEMWEDTQDLALSAARAITAGPDRTSLDDVLAEFGYSRDELRSMPD
jgi:phage gp37-like protein